VVERISFTSKLSTGPEITHLDAAPFVDAVLTAAGYLSKLVEDGGAPEDGPTVARGRRSAAAGRDRTSSCRRAPQRRRTAPSRRASRAALRWTGAGSLRTAGPRHDVADRPKP
jgi:hypothetical protein